MAYKDLMEKASDSLARLVAKAAKPIYSKTKPTRKKKSVKEPSDDLSENYIYISSLSKVSNKSCPVRDKSMASEIEVPKKRRTSTVQVDAPPRKKSNKPLEKKQAHQPVLQSVVQEVPAEPSAIIHQASPEPVKQALRAQKPQKTQRVQSYTQKKVAPTWGFDEVQKLILNKYQKTRESLKLASGTLLEGCRGLEIHKIGDKLKSIDLQASKAWFGKHVLQVAGVSGVALTLVVGTILYSEMSKVPVVGAIPSENPVEKQVVANSFNSTQTIMLEDRVPGKPDLSDVISMENVSAYSKPGYAGYAIGINGKEVGFFNQQAQAQAVLEKIKGRYAVVQKDRQIVKVFFKERVSIVQGFRPVGQISDYSVAASAENYILKGSKEEQAYVVQEGETFWDIAVKNNISVDSLLAANPDIKPERLQIGDELSLLSPKPLVTVCVVEKAKMNEAIPYEVKYVEAKALFKGDTTVKSKGQNGERIIVADILKENGNIVARNVISETILSHPITKVVSKGTKDKPRTAATGKFARPIGRGASFSSDFGWRWGRRHTGVDLSCHVGTSVFAADGGTVSLAGSYQAYGKCIIINHGNGLQTYYAHNSKLLVSPGDKVYKGQKIALSGNTGRSTGPHLHFEVRRGGVPVDPEKYLRLR